MKASRWTRHILKKFGWISPRAISSETLTMEEATELVLANSPFNISIPVPSEETKTALDIIWSKHNSEVFYIAQGTHVWHGGIIGPGSPLDDKKGLWVTKNAEKKDHYIGWANQDAMRLQRTPYLLEFETKKVLRLAHFNQASLEQFTKDYCNFNHDLMKATVIEWINSHDLDGIVSVNGDDDEVIICSPVSKLTQVSARQL